MIDDLRFFPCIVAWVPFNEGWGQYDTNDILKWVKEYDPTRLVNGPSGWADRGYGDMKDMHIYPGPGMFPAMPEPRQRCSASSAGWACRSRATCGRTTRTGATARFKTTEELRDNYRQLMRRLHPLIGKGLVGGGLHADDRCGSRGQRPDDLRPRGDQARPGARRAKWHKALFGPPPEFRDSCRPREKARRSGSYTTDKPADGWEKPDFDAGKWTDRRRRLRHRRGRPAPSSAPSGRRPTSGSAAASS